MSLHPLRNASQVPAHRKKLDGEITTLTSHLIRIKQERNALACISALPAELMCRIFVQCRDEWPERSAAKMAWVVITHVCHAWRALALGYSSLWGNLHSAVGDKWLSTLLKRVKKSPIILTIVYKDDHGSHNSFSERRNALLAAALSRTAQLVELNLESHSSETLQQVLEQMTEPAENLQVLKIDSLFSFPSNIRIPPGFLSNRAPRLTRLDLTNVDFTWNPVIWGNLTNLQCLSGSSNLSPEVLQAITHLEELQLSTPVAGLQTSNSPTCLPGLRKLALLGSFQDCGQFLQSLKLPGCTSLLLVCNGDLDGSDLCDALESSWKSSSSTTITSSFTNLELHLKTSLGTASWVATSDTHRLVFSTRSTDFDTPVLERLLLRVLPLESIKNLHIESYEAAEIDVKAILARMSLLDGLKLEGQVATEVVVEYLMTDPAFEREPHQELAQIALLPHLRWIEIIGTPFKPRETAPSHQVTSLAVDYGKFQDLLLRRFAHDAWATLEEVTFVDCLGLGDIEMDDLAASVDIFFSETEVDGINDGCKCCDDVKCPGCESDAEDIGV
ncbi:hypothetical protein BKA70DRAFT_552347 [Coprinopsis sp. MPI-PUGE-AT-0042]|nr:hypothetical protein BKA70DRAFT_552347 [Coprinopsis sp. MPI-PUGE-AT-0042]